jgi:hypothetical protein
MFCPEGYVSLYDTVSEFERFGEAWWAKTGYTVQKAEHLVNQEDHVKTHGSLDNYFDIDVDEDTPILAYRIWATFRFVLRSSERFFASSPDGKLMRIGQYVFGAGRVYDGPFPTAYAEQRSILDYLDTGFWHLDERYFLIRLCADNFAIEAFELEKEIDVLSAFRGWAICWKPKSMDSWRDELRAILEDEATPLPVHRHRISDERRAAALMVAMYDTDDQVTKAACRERVGPNLGTHAFGRAWEAAKVERHGLGLGGRPKSKPQT